jgi:putative peptidoglycan lipid II flippase
MTADTLQLFAVSLLPFSVYLYALRAFYATEGTRTPFLINLGENLTNVVLAAALFPAYGIRGLAVAWTAAYSLAAVAALVVLRKRVGSGIGVGVRGAALRAGAGTLAFVVVAAPIAALIGRQTPGRGVLACAVAGGLGAAAYAAALAVTRSPELREILRLVRGNRRNAPGVSP